MKKEFWLSTAFRKLLICYLIVLLLPTCFSIGAYRNFAAHFERKNDEAHEQALSQAAMVIDERLKAVERLCDTISFSSPVMDLGRFDLPFTAEKYYGIHQDAKALSAFSVLEEVAQYVYIYCGKLDCVVDQGHIYTENNQLEKIITQRMGMERGEFARMMEQNHARGFRITGSGETLICVHTLAREGGRPVLTLIVVMNPQPVSKLLSSTAAGTGGTVYIRQQGGKTMGGAGEENLPETPGLVRQRDGVTITRHSEVTDFTYVLHLPMAVFTRETARYQVIYLWAMGVLLVAGVIMCYVLAARNYKPIYTLKRVADIDATEHNDFDAIQQKIREVLDSKQKMHEEIDQLNKIASYQAFHALIVGDMERMQRDTQAALDIRFEGDLFVACMIDLDIVKGTQPVVELGRSGEINVVINEILARLCENVCQYVVRREEETFYVVFCFRDLADGEAQMRALDLMEDLLKMIYENLSMSALAYVGDAQHGIENVHVSCENAGKAREYAEFVGETEKRIIIYDPSMFSAEMPSEDYDIMDAERRFSLLLLSGDYNLAKSILYQIVAYYRCRDGMSLYIMRCRMFGLMNLMLNAIHEIEPDLNAAFYKECRPIENILSAKNMHELEMVLFSIVDQLIGRQEVHSNDAQDRIRQIIGYIRSHYYDINLSVQQVADQFDMSLPYLSRIFKENTQVGLLTFINQYRVDKAKEILREDENVTLAEVAERVGYNCSQTLIRTFKRHEGITPGAYRASLSSEDAISDEKEETPNDQ